MLIGDWSLNTWCDLVRWYSYVQTVYFEKVPVQGVMTFNLQETELAAQENVNSIPLSHRVADIQAQYATVDQALKPGEVSTLPELASPSSSRPDYNRNGLPEKDRAAGIPFDSEIMEDKFGYSASDMTHNKNIESRLAEVETKLAQIQPLHEELIRSRQISTEQIKADQVQVQVQVLKDDVAKLESDFDEMKSLFQGQFTEIIHCLNVQTPYRAHEELSRFIINSKVDMEERIQTLERRSQSLEAMMDKLTKTITKLHLVCEVCGAPNVQGAPWVLVWGFDVHAILQFIVVVKVSKNIVTSGTLYTSLGYWMDNAKVCNVLAIV